jgi:hypothetical protein
MAVNPLGTLVRLFVNTFGITQPTPENEQRAGRVILGMLVAVVLMLAIAGYILRSAMVR